MRWASRSALAVLASAALVLAGNAGRAHGEAWHSAQPPAPPPQEGQTAAGVPVPLGHIGQISFWAPNHGLLITAGNEAVHAGLYYYNGVAWQRLSTVCGGTDGRIAWAGPDDFWTIADQQTGQQIQLGSSTEIEQDRSLCHFEDGRVVASYAEPIGVADSYQRMDAAACTAPDDCWFGGERLSTSVNSGAFHLHWNGSSLTPVPSLENSEPQLEDPERDVADIVAFKGRFYESVQVRQDDQVSSSESATNPYLLHRIVEGSTSPFAPEVPEGPFGAPFVYGTAGVQPWQLSAFSMSASPTQLWAFAGPDGQPGSGGQALFTALLYQSGIFEQVQLQDPSGAFQAGQQIAGVAAEPGAADAWVSLAPPGEPSEQEVARLVRVHSDGTVDPAEQLPQPSEGIGHKGPAGAIDCPAAGDCWLATAKGWLFHLGGNQPQDEDPYFQQLITYRPPDASLPFTAPDEAPPDDSGANPASLPSLPVATPKVAQSKVRAPLFSHVVEKLVASTTLSVTFTLATKSHVRLVADRRRRQVAATARVTLTRGRHTLRLRLDRRRWPTKLDLQVKAIGQVPYVTSGPAVGGPTTIGTVLRAPVESRLATTQLLP